MIWLILIVGLIIIGNLGIHGYYRKWLKVQTKRVSADSKIIQTSRGQVEYDMRGHGPTVLHFHGGNVGHNGWFFLAHLVERGYRLLTPDRPGYAELITVEQVGHFIWWGDAQVTKDFQKRIEIFLDENFKLREQSG